MIEILLLAATLMGVCFLVRYYWQREGLPPKAQLLSDTWEITEGKKSINPENSGSKAFSKGYILSH